MCLRRCRNTGLAKRRVESLDFLLIMNSLNKSTDSLMQEIIYGIAILSS